MEEKQTEKTVGRNEPCPCGSGKKYKRCCGINAAPKFTPPSWAPPAGAEGTEAAAGAGNPYEALQGMDPQMMMQLAQAMQRLPKGQIQKMQALMQKAMAGKDVTREAKELERALPPSFMEMMKGFQMPGMPGMADQAALETTAEPVVEGEMTAEKAKAIVEQAVAEGKLNEEQAEQLLAAAETDSTQEQSPAEKEEGGFSKLWKKLGGSKKS